VVLKCAEKPEPKKNPKINKHESVKLKFICPYPHRSRAALVSRGFDSVVISKRVCGVRLFAFWQKFKSAVIAGDKAAVAEMTKFPLSMPYEVKP
jgi:hypothetical protein